MQAGEAITRLDRGCPNQFTDAEKLEWLLTLEGELCREVFSPFKGAPSLPESLSLSDTLNAPKPYDVLYVYGMEANVHRLTGDTVRYQNAATLFNETVAGLVRYLCRTRETDGRPVRYY